MKQTRIVIIMKLLWILLMCVFQHVAAKNQLTVHQKMNPSKTEERICTSYKLNSSLTYHLTKFHPIVSDEAIHHIVFGMCDEPGSYEPYWNCEDIPGKENTEPGLPVHDSCKNFAMPVLYEKAFGTGDMILPEDHAFEVGKDTKWNYLVLQVHYSNNPVGKLHSTDIVVSYELKPRSPSTTTWFDISHDDYSSILKPHQTTILEAYREATVPMHPIIYQVHTHLLGRNVSLYAVKRNGEGNGMDTWVKLGKRDPRLPQNYVPVDNEVTVQPGDGIAIRCTFYNDGEEDVEVGSRRADEMCDVSLTTWVKAEDADKIYEEKNYMRKAWDDIGLTNIPYDA